MSLSASIDNISTADTQSCDSSNMCLELALEGERLCKAGDCRAGVAFFQAAIQAGTEDLRTLSAIYSQLGNAYFYLGDYVKAMQYHKLDLTLARTMGDKLGEAKSSGNLGNTLKVMGKFDEAMICCKRHLEISRELNDKLSEGRALYNLGNVYHAKGKHIGRVGQQDPGEFPEDVKECLLQAVFYYEENLKLMKELGDRAAQGRACGNLGNTYYLLGDFQRAIQYHHERLKIAREFGDKAAERRAYSNLGNSHIFLGEFEKAAEHYKRTLELAQELSDRAIEAQACYSLGNTYTLLRDYPTAIDYHFRHLDIAQALMDRVGEGRACWSLGNAHSAMGNHEKALHFASRHLEISKEVGDTVGQATAAMNISDLRKALGLPVGEFSPETAARLLSSATAPPGGSAHHLLQTPPLANTAASSPHLRRYSRVRRESMTRLEVIKLTPDGKARNNAEATLAHTPLPQHHHADQQSGDEEDSFFELLSRFQSERMDDQRCSLSLLSSSEDKENQYSNSASSLSLSNGGGDGMGGSEELLDLIAGMQSKRMDEQRVALPHLPGLCPPQGLGGGGTRDGSPAPDESFLEQLMRCQGERLEDQRSPLPRAGTGGGGGPGGGGDSPAAGGQSSSESGTAGGHLPPPPPAPAAGSTVPDEDFFSLILRLQSGRMEDQRAAVPGHLKQ